MFTGAFAVWKQGQEAFRLTFAEGLKCRLSMLFPNEAKWTSIALSCMCVCVSFSFSSSSFFFVVVDTVKAVNLLNVSL